MKIKGQAFENDDVNLDGNQFEDCVFKKCRMHFSGVHPMTLIRCDFADVSWFFDSNAALTMDFMKAMLSLPNDYGKFLLINTFPELMPLIKPEYLEKMLAKSGVNNGRQ